MPTILMVHTFECNASSPLGDSRPRRPDQLNRTRPKAGPLGAVSALTAGRTLDAWTDVHADDQN
jgi:hypothetical protein